MKNRTSQLSNYSHYLILGYVIGVVHTIQELTDSQPVNKLLKLTTTNLASFTTITTNSNHIISYIINNKKNNNIINNNNNNNYKDAIKQSD